MSEAEAAQLILCPSKHWKSCNCQSTWRTLGGSQENAPEPISKGRRAPGPTVPDAGVETKQSHNRIPWERHTQVQEDTQSWQNELYPCSADLNQGPGEEEKAALARAHQPQTLPEPAACPAHFKPPLHPEGWAGSSGQGTKTRRK